MNIVMTGGTGFLGVHLVRALLEADDRVRITVLTRTKPASALARLTEFLAGHRVDRLTVLRADLTRPRLGLAEADHRELAERCDTIWHCAADTRLGAELADLRRTNVAGTAAVLDLAASCRRPPRLFHVSTAFVAGARRTGTVLPDDLDDSHGFENPYERSKFEAERLVRDWAARRCHPTVVYRPSILVTDRPDRPGLPALGYLSFARAVAVARVALLTRRMPMPTGLELRLTGDPAGHMNLLPVDLAAARMVRLARHGPAEMVTAHHVVHHHEVPVTTVVDVVNQVVGQTLDCRVVLVPEPVPDPSVWERLVAGRGVLGYLRHRRRYDDASVRAVDAVRPGMVVDRDYLTTLADGYTGALVGRSR